MSVEPESAYQRPPSFRSGKPRVLLADDHALFTAALKTLLEPEFEVVGTVLNGRLLLQEAARLCPEVVLLDLSMPLMNGTEAGRRLHEILPRTKIIVVTASEDATQQVVEALDSWASGFLLKKDAADELIQAILRVLKGMRYVTQSMRQKLEDAFIRGGFRPSDNQLTPRQREVLQLLAEGHSMKETANILDMTARTVAFHKYRIMENLGLKTNSDLFNLAIKEGLFYTH
jgi:DNA-binding NarL/FixJ family response regulator